MMRSLIVSLKTVKPSQWSRECWKILDEFQIRSQRLTNTHHPLSFLVIFSVNSQRWQLYVFCLILLCTYCPPTCYSLHDNITLCGIESEWMNEIWPNLISVHHVFQKVILSFSCIKDIFQSIQNMKFNPIFLTYFSSPYKHTCFIYYNKREPFTLVPKS